MNDEAREAMKKLYETKLEILKTEKAAVEQGLIEPCTTDNKIHFMDDLGIVAIDGKIFKVRQCSFCKKILKEELVEIWLNKNMILGENKNE